MPELPGHHSKYEKWRSDVVIARFIEMCIGAAVLGATYVLIGTGYNLAYSTVRVISFAQGQLAMVGSMVFARRGRAAFRYRWRCSSQWSSPARYRFL